MPPVRGKARVELTLSDTLEESTIAASTSGDLFQLVGEQTVQLLALWDPDGNPVGDLGDLAKPTVEPFTLGVRLFPPAGATTPPVDSPVQQLFASLFTPLYRPLLEQFAIEDVSGELSNAMAAWSYAGTSTCRDPRMYVRGPVARRASSESRSANAGETQAAPIRSRTRGDGRTSDRAAEPQRDRRSQDDDPVQGRRAAGLPRLSGGRPALESRSEGDARRPRPRGRRAGGAGDERRADARRLGRRGDGSSQSTQAGWITCWTLGPRESAQRGR